jgi:4-amino-4-deoxy-L-arabinose transferase-like glycosyltransferase
MEMLKHVPRAAWVCAAIAILNAVCWSILIPPLQGPDEQAHFAYVQQLAENGALPNGSPEENFSPEEQTAMRDLEFGETILNPATPSIPSRAKRQQLLSDLSQPLSRKGDGSVGVANSEPPLYYALQTIPYELGSGSTLLTQLELMRLLSALLAGLTVLFVFLFLREALPAVPWAWTVGGLCAALSPLFGFVGGSLDPDALLFVVCAAMFYCLARAFRRGLTPPLAAALGAVVATGFTTKVNFLGLVPGIFVGIIILTVREARISRRTAYRSLALAVGIAISPILLYALHNIQAHKPLLGIISGSFQSLGLHPLSSEFDYAWQLYLPRLPGMASDFPGITPLTQIWFKGIVGRYNWLETVFPGWVYTVALIPAAAIGGLCIRELRLRRDALLGRKGEFAVYLIISLGLMGLLAGASFVNFPTLNAGDSEPRYFLPLLALGSALLALAARGAGRRWGPAAGAAIVVLMLTHNILSQLLEISRYYHA